MTARCWFILGICGALQAQQALTPTTEPVGSPRGENRGDYNITQSFETGYRWNRVFGSADEYRSDANYGNGIRLLGTSLSVNSKDGHGHLFDEISLDTMGLGNDPDESVTLRIQKNALYRYDALWRLSDYANAGLTVSGGAHLENTQRRMQDHDLTLGPQSKLQLHLGYSRNTESGPALSSAQEFDVNGQGYPVFTDVRRQWNEYRVGAEANVKGFKLTVLRRWDFYKDDTPATADGIVAAGPTTGNTDVTVLRQFNASQPVHGSNSGWLGNLFTRRKRWATNARLAYSGGRDNFALLESAAGIGQFGSPASRQIVVSGDAKRPDLVGDWGLDFFPSARLTVTNHASLANTRIDGASSYSEVLTGTSLGLTVSFRYLGVRTLTNSTMANYRAAKWLGFYAGWNYSDRGVATTEGVTLPAYANSTANNSYEVSDQVQSGIAGVRLRPIHPLTVNLDGEVGRATQPLTPLADNRFHTSGGRVDYKLKRTQLSTAYREAYNNNRPIDFEYSYSHSRTYSASGSWSPAGWFSVDASYTHMHLDSWSFLAFFSGVGRPALQTSYGSRYLSNLHAANLGARWAMGRRADLYAGYSITKDVGDGRATPAPAGTANAVTVLLDSVQTFPLTYQSPLARLSVKVSPKLRWNAGWQYYGYGERFKMLTYYQNFHAHTGYTSILWTF